MAIAPGYLQRSWEQDGRHFYEYSMGSTHIQDFFAYLSARYTLRKEVYSGPNGPVNLEVYYDPAHTYDIDDMLASSRAGLDYFQAHYSPYQFTQYRIMEFPRYRNFAQSFPNTIPYSEGIGFIGRMLKPDDVDLTYFVTAHELGHQWWGHQLIGGQVQGSNMMSETLAQYSAYMVMQQKYGKDYMHKVLRHYLDHYLRGRSGEVRHEPPLALVQREPYVWYQKGGQIMYTLADYIGEDKIDIALQNFLMQYRYANANNQVDAAEHLAQFGRPALPRHPDAGGRADGADAARNTGTWWTMDSTASCCTTTRRSPRFRRRRRMASTKSRSTCRRASCRPTATEWNRPCRSRIISRSASSAGRRTSEKPLYMKKEKLTQEQQTFTIVVDQQPTRAGIDPYNKLIDRIADDNMIDVTSRSPQ